MSDPPASSDDQASPQTLREWLAEFNLPLAVPQIGRRYLHGDDAARGGAARNFDELGRGGAATVYVGEDQDLHRQVAIKVLRKRYHRDRAAVARFLYEARLTAQLQHPSVVPVYDIGLLGNDELFFSMERVRGRTLRSIMDEAQEHQKAWPRERLLSIYEQVCHSVAYAHSLHVIHSDLKPENIMVGDFHEVFVMDWGIARVLDDSPLQPKLKSLIDVLQVEEQGQTKGTARYMSPEQVLGMARQVTPRSDVFSLGIILYEILARRHPFETSDTRELLNAIARLDPPRLKDWRLPRDFVTICEKALAKLPGSRYPSAIELAADVSSAREHRPLSTDRTISQHVIKYGRRNLALATVFMLLLGALGACGWFWQQAEGARRGRMELAKDRLFRIQSISKELRQKELQSMNATGRWREALLQEVRGLRTEQRAEARAARVLLVELALDLEQRTPEWARYRLKSIWMQEVQDALDAGDAAGARYALQELEQFLRDLPGLLPFSAADDVLRRDLGRRLAAAADPSPTPPAP